MIDAWHIRAKSRARNKFTPDNFSERPSSNMMLKRKVPSEKPKSPINIISFRPSRSLKRPHLGVAKKTVREETAIILVICSSFSPSCLPTGVRIGNRTENPTPIIAKHARRVLRDLICSNLRLFSPASLVTWRNTFYLIDSDSFDYDRWRHASSGAHCNQTGIKISSLELI